MRKGSFLGIIAFVLFLVAGFAAYKVFGPTVSVTAKTEYFYLTSGKSADEAIQELKEQNFIGETMWANWVKAAFKFNTAKPGRYSFPSGTSLFSIIRKLKNGQQSLVKLTIIKERTKELLAGKIGNKLDTEIDSLDMIQFFNSNDSLANFHVDSNTFIGLVLPYNYDLKWNDSPRKIVEKFKKSYDEYWTPERKEKASKKGLTPMQVSIMASIIEEESNKKQDRLNIASTYLNRLKIGMKLQADPTAKFVTRNFNLGRITYEHLALQSPYNTYLHAGLPPGPICTPSFDAIECVLNAPKTDYLYFVASYKFDGSTIFTSNYEDHTKFVNLFHKEQNRRADSLKRLRENP